MNVRRLIGCVFAVSAAGAFLAGCSNLRRLAKSDPGVALSLPARMTASEEVYADTLQAPKIITFRKEDGTELYIAPVATDSVSGEEMMSVAIDEVVISAANRRNLVERNGKINVDFVVTVPRTLQDRAWRLRLDPQVLKGDDTLVFDPLVYSGDKFRTMQERQYARYEAYCDRIVDSADYFDRFGDKRAYARSLDRRETLHASDLSDYALLERLTPREAEMDNRVGWMTPRERRRQYRLLHAYVRATDRKVARRIVYTPDADDRFDHLNDYLAPRYRYEGVDVLPGGEIFTRVEGDYPDAGDRRRESYLRALEESRERVRSEVKGATDETICGMAADRETWTGYERPMIGGILRELTDSAVCDQYLSRKNALAGAIDAYDRFDPEALKRNLLRENRVDRNRRLAAGREQAFARRVHNPYIEHPRLDTVIGMPDGSVRYYYTQQVQADENTSKLRLYLAGEALDRSGRRWQLGKSDTLIYNVASMTTFLDETPRYMQRIVLRDAEANARFFFTFPQGRSRLVDTLTANRKQIAAVRALTRDLMTDPVYIIDSITLQATSSPEGSWRINDRLAAERAEALRRVLVAEFRVLYDSLKVAASVTIDEEGRMKTIEEDGMPDLPNLLRTKHLAEDWTSLKKMIERDERMPDREGVLALIAGVENPDTREYRIRAKYPQAYAYMSRVFYPEMRAVDFRFNLHRRGMKQDTVWTTEIDSNYMHAVELLRKRRYEEALTILRPYEDRNTALAYMSLGYDAAAYRTLKACPEAAATADLQYMLAILASRLGDEEQAVRYFLRAVELRENLKFRGNLDPEISRLIRRYGLFREDFM